MKFKRGDKVKIKKNTTLEEIAKNHFNGCQIDTMKFLLNTSFDSFEGNFIVKKVLTADCVELNNSFLVNAIILDKIKGILDDKEKEYLKKVIEPFRNRIKYINLEISFDEYGAVYIVVHLENNDSMILPNFKKGTMYKNMEVNKEYSLEELGLNE
jgi:hypothetical protein